MTKPYSGGIHTHLVSCYCQVTPQIQKAEVIRKRSNNYLVAATVENIMVRIPGKNNSKAILIMSHYDTVPTAYGATDDGSGNVAMLESLRALLKSKQLQNDVIFLFTDGEEIGLMGAKAFADQHPWAKDIGLVLNFEGSGSSGQTLMFETSDKNGWLIQEFAKASPYPAANSISYEIYKRMPNDTDLSIFKRKGIPGLNFAYIDDRYDYHTANDNIHNIDIRSVQHHGEYLLSLVKHFGNLNLKEIKSTNQVYFNTIGYGFVHYSEKWVIPLFIFVTIVFIITLILAFRAKEITLSGLLVGFIAFLCHLVLAPIVIVCLFLMISKPFSGTDWWLLLYNQKTLLLASAFLTSAISFFFYSFIRKGIGIFHCLFLAIFLIILLLVIGLFSWTYLLLTLIIFTLLYVLFRKEISVWNLSFGSLVGWVILMITVSIFIPGGSYMVTWPLFFCLIPILVFFLTKTKNIISTVNISLFAIFAIPTVLWFSGFTYLYFIAMGLNMLGFVMILVTVALGLLIPQIYIINSYKKWLFPAILITCGIIFLLISTVGVNFDNRFRKPNTLFYLNDFDKNRSYWATNNLRTDEWLGKYISSNPDTIKFSEILPNAKGKILKTVAPNLNSPAPIINVIEDNTNEKNRIVKLHIVSERQAPTISLFIDPKITIVAANINNHNITGFTNSETESTNQWKRWNYYGLPKDGFNLTLQVETMEPFEIKLIEYSYGFPELQNFSFEERPEHMMPVPYSYSDMTLSYKTFTF